MLAQLGDSQGEGTNSRRTKREDTMTQPPMIFGRRPIHSCYVNSSSWDSTVSSRLMRTWRAALQPPRLSLFEEQWLTLLPRNRSLHRRCRSRTNRPGRKGRQKSRQRRKKRKEGQRKPQPKGRGGRQNRAREYRRKRKMADN